MKAPMWAWTRVPRWRSLNKKRNNKFTGTIHKVTIELKETKTDAR
jgi:hypothetical protein